VLAAPDEQNIDKNSYISLYIQLKNIIKKMITSKKIAAGNKIPSENELSRQYGISRMTVRQAVKELISEGYLYIKRGEGTYVKDIDNIQTLIKLEGFSREMEKLGHRTFSRTIIARELDYQDRNKDVYDNLNLPYSAKPVYIKRIRYLDNEPFALESSYLAPFPGKKILNLDLQKDQSIYKYIEENCGIQLIKAEHIIEPILARKDITEHLQISKGTPLLFIRGTTYGYGNKPVEYLKGIYRSDKHAFKVKILK